MKIIYESNIKDFKDKLVDDEKSDSTLEKYERDVKCFAAWLENREACKSICLEYKKILVENYAPQSVNSMISSLNSFFEFMGWHDCKIKTLKIQKRIFLSPEKELNKSEYEKLLDAAKLKTNKRLYLLMQTICSTGIRVSELKFITVEALKNRQAIINCKGKMRIVIIPKKLCNVLLDYVRSQRIKNGSVFVSRNGNPLNRSNIWADMKKLCKSAGVSRDKVFPHNLRHLFARTYYSVQRDIVRLADILGHGSINTTRIYTMESGYVHMQQIQQLGLFRC